MEGLRALEWGSGGARGLLIRGHTARAPYRAQVDTQRWQLAAKTQLRRARSHAQRDWPIEHARASQQAHSIRPTVGFVRKGRA